MTENEESLAEALAELIVREIDMRPPGFAEWRSAEEDRKTRAAVIESLGSVIREVMTEHLARAFGVVVQPLDAAANPPGRKHD